MAEWLYQMYDSKANTQLLQKCSENISNPCEYDVGKHAASSKIESKVNRARFNALRPRQNGRHFADDIFKCIFLNENGWIPITISLQFVPQGSINNIPALVQIMAWRRPGDKPLSGPLMVRLPTHICVIRPQGVNAWGWIKWPPFCRQHCSFELHWTLFV